MKSSAGNKKESPEKTRKSPIPPAGKSAAKKINEVKARPSSKTAIKVQIKKQDEKKTATSNLKKTDVKKITVSFAPVKKTVKKPAPAKKAVKKSVAPKKTAPVSAKMLPKEPAKLLPKEATKVLPVEAPKVLPIEAPKEQVKESPKVVPEPTVEIKAGFEAENAALKAPVSESSPKDAFAKDARKYVDPKRTVVKSVKEPTKASPPETTKSLPKETAKLLPNESPKSLPVEAPKVLPVEAAKEQVKESPKIVPESPREIKAVFEDAGTAPKAPAGESSPKDAGKYVDPKETVVRSVKELTMALPEEPTKLLPAEAPKELPKVLPVEAPKALQIEAPKESPKIIPEPPVEIKVAIETVGAVPKPAKSESIPEEAHSLSKSDPEKVQEQDKGKASPVSKAEDAGLAAQNDDDNEIILNEAYAVDSHGNKLSLHQEFIPDLDSQLSKAKILVADDSVIYQVGYMQMLEFLGHEVVMCGNGLQAVKRFKETHPELVILDVDMPEMNGFEACREIRKTPEGLNVPIIMVSSGDTEEDIVNGMNAGANDYLIKPVKEAHMIAKLKTFLKFTVVHKDDLELVKKHVVFAGRYVIEKLIGYGPHSVVFLGKDKSKGRRVAIKLVSTPELETYSIAFAGIAEKVKKIDSPNVLKILDFGQYAGRFYTILEFAENGSLARLFKQRKLTEEETVKLALELISGLKEFDRNGIVHFNIKPENIMISGSVCKLGDFGIAAQRDTATIAIKTEMWNTVAYMPPEYLNDSSAVTGKSDIYSLGVMLYQAVTGDNPFQSVKPTVSMFNQVNLVPPALETFDRRITKYFSDTVAAMMDKNPDGRPSLVEIENVFKHILTFLATRPPEVEKEADAGESFQKAKKELDVITEASPTIAAKKVKPQKKILKGLTLSKFGFARSAATAVLLLGLSTYSGYLVYTQIFDRAEQAEPGALSSVICLNCKKAYEKRVVDIKKEKCPLCGGTIAYRQKCYSCKNEFPYKTPDANPANFKLAAKETAELNKCPKCSSTDTDPAPTSIEKKQTMYRK